MIKLISCVHNDLPENARSMKQETLNIQRLREEKFENKI